MSEKKTLLIVNNFDSSTIEKLDSAYDTHKLWHAKTKEERNALLDCISHECTAIATGNFANEKLLASLDNLQMIANFSVGTDGIDLEFARSRNILVSNTPDVLNDEVADLGIALMLACSRKLVTADAFVREGQWMKQKMVFGQGLKGKTLGILGMGRIGEEIAQRALAFKMNVVYHNRHEKNIPYKYFSTASQLASHCDIMLNVLPSTNDTKQLVDKEIFAALGKEGIFINIGRGNTVDQDALISVLQNKSILAAGLDVYANEPNVAQELIALDNVVLTPHIGSATFETRAAMGKLVVNNLAAFFSQNPLVTPVN